MIRTRWAASLPALLTIALVASSPLPACAQESEEIVGTTGSTSMTIEVLERSDYDLGVQSEPKGDSDQASKGEGYSSADEPVYGDMPQTGGQASQGALLACASALGLFLVGLEVRR